MGQDIMYRNFMLICFFLSNLLISTASVEAKISQQNVTALSHHAKITSIHLEEGFIVLNNTPYNMDPKIPVSNHENLPLDSGNLSPGQQVEFWTDTSHHRSYLPSITQNVNVIKIRIISHVNQESIYH